MGFIDISGYDLTSPKGQDSAIQDMLDEVNEQFDQLNTVTSFSVAAYTQMTVSVAPGQPTGMYSSTYTHGLGFPPVVLAYFLQSAANGFYALLPYNQAQFGSLIGPSLGYQYFSVDSSNVYLNYQNIGTSAGNIITAAFYIFNIPLGQ